MFGIWWGQVLYIRKVSFYLIFLLLIWICKKKYKAWGHIALNWSNVKAFRVIFLSFISYIIVSPLICILFIFCAALSYLLASLFRWCFRWFILAMCRSAEFSIILRFCLLLCNQRPVLVQCSWYNGFCYIVLGIG